MCDSTYYRLRIKILKDLEKKGLVILTGFTAKEFHVTKNTLSEILVKIGGRKPSLASEMEPGLLPALQNFNFKIKIT